MAKQKDWFESDWYRGIAEVVQAIRENDANMADPEDVDALQPESGRRADTMMQDKFDYLSDGRRADYKAWKDAQLVRIAQILEGQGSMEIDAH